MKGILHLIVTKKERFDAPPPAPTALTTYRFNTGVAEHTFCSVCGIHSFYVPRSHPDGIDVNLRCLDGDVMSRFQVETFDGARWEESVDSIRR